MTGRRRVIDAYLADRPAISAALVTFDIGPVAWRPDVGLAVELVASSCGKAADRVSRTLVSFDNRALALLAATGQAGRLLRRLRAMGYRILPCANSLTSKRDDVRMRYDP